MTNLTALIRTARAAWEAKAAAEKSVLVYSGAVEGNVTVRIVPVQPRGLSGRWSQRADVYIAGKRIKTADLKAMLAAETA